MNYAEALTEIEWGTPSPQRRRYLRSLLVCADLEREPCCADIDSQRCPATQAAPVVMHSGQNSACCPQAMKSPNRHSELGTR